MTQSGEEKPIPIADQGRLFSNQIVNNDSNSEEQRSLETWPGEKLAIQAILAEFKKLTSPLQGVIIVKPGEPDSLDKLDTALARLPNGDTFGQMIDGLRKKAMDSIALARRERIQNFKRTETDFLKNLRIQNKAFREQAHGWRIGPLELQVKHEYAQCRWLYNREILTEWIKVSNIDILQRSMMKSLDLLKKMSLPEPELEDLFWETFNDCVRLQQGNRANPGLVPLPKFYRQLRITLVNHELKQKPDKKLLFAEFPRWAFLYNLDLYRKSSSISKEKSLGLQTGSQQETQSFGMVTNGLDPNQDYRVVCYIIKGG